MTPGEDIRRQKNVYLALVAVGFGVMMVLAFVERHLPPGIYRPILYGAIALFALGNLLLYVGIRCPKCRATLGVRMMFSGKAVDRCPRCGTDFH